MASKQERNEWNQIMREKRKLTKIAKSLKESIGEIETETWGAETYQLSHYDHILCVFEVIDSKMVYRFWLVSWLDTINEPCEHYRGSVSIPDSLMGKSHGPFHDEFRRIRMELGLQLVYDGGFVEVYRTTENPQPKGDGE